MLYRLRNLVLFDASTIENIVKICKYYGINQTARLLQIGLYNEWKGLAPLLA